MKKPLTNKAALVTGSSSGIGRAIAVKLAEAGADVFVHAGSNKIGASETCDLIRFSGARTDFALCDLATSGGRKELLAATTRWSPEINVLINCAGADVLTGNAADWSFEEKLQQLWRVDVQAAMFLSRKIGEQMKTRGEGVVINIGWDQADVGMEGDSGEMFAATKGAVMAFTKSLAKSLAPGVRVNCIAPGWIQTAWGSDTSDYWNQRAISESLLGRWGTPEDVAAAALFLASPASAFMTGQIMQVNGGLRISPDRRAEDE